MFSSDYSQPGSQPTIQATTQSASQPVSQIVIQRDFHIQVVGLFIIKTLENAYSLHIRI